MDEVWKEVVAEWGGGYGFIGTNPDGGSVQMGTLDGKPGVSPMEMLLLGVAGCTGVDIISILSKKRKKLTALQVRVRGKRANEHPKIYTEIEVIYELKGEDLDEKSVEQAIQLSEEKYCSASAMLSAVAQVHWRYTIQESAD